MIRILSVTEIEVFFFFGISQKEFGATKDQTAAEIKFTVLRYVK